MFKSDYSTSEGDCERSPFLPSSPTLHPTPPTSYFQLYHGFYLLSLIAVMTSLIVGATFACFTAVLSQTIEVINEHDYEDGYWTGSRLVTVVGGLGAIALIAGGISHLCFTTISRGITTQYRKRYFRNISYKPESELIGINREEVSHQMESDWEAIHKGTGYSVMVSVQTAGFCIVAVSLATVINWEVSVVTGVAVGVSLLCSTICTLLQVSEEQRMTHAFTPSTSLALEALHNVDTIDMYTAQSHILQQYTSSLPSYSFTSLLITLTRGVSCTGPLLSGCLLVFLYHENWLNNVTVTELITIWWLLGITSLSPIFLIPGILDATQAQSAAARATVFSHLPDTNSKSLFQWKFKGDIEFNNVTFSSPTDKIGLKGLSFKCPKEQITVIFGDFPTCKFLPSLFLRFSEPFSGFISIDSIPLTNIDISCLRRQIAYIDNDPQLFSLSIEENIHMAAPNATSEDVEMAAKEANIFDWILSLQDGFLTQIGRNSQITLTKRQKLGIILARALLKKCSIFLIEEDKTALDSESDSQNIYETLSNLHKKHTLTTIIVSNNLTTAQKADQIVVFDQGRCVESGKRQEVMQGKMLEKEGSLGNDPFEGKNELINEKNGENKEKNKGNAVKMSKKGKVLMSLGAIFAGISAVCVLFIGNLMQKVLFSGKNYSILLLISALIAVLSLILSNFFLNFAVFTFQTDFQHIKMNDLLHNYSDFLGNNRKICYIVDYLHRILPGNSQNYGNFIGALSFLAVILVGIIAEMIYFRCILTGFLIFIVFFVVIFAKICRCDEKIDQKAVNLLESEVLKYSKSVQIDELQANLINLHEKYLHTIVERARLGSYMRSFWYSLSVMSPFVVFECVLGVLLWVFPLQKGSKEAVLWVEITSLGVILCVWLVFQNIQKNGFGVDSGMEEVTANRGTEGVITPITGQIAFSGVSLRLSDCILNNVTFEIASETCVGVLGATNAEKSMILQLIMRVYEPTEGGITLDGVDLQLYDLSHLRRHLVYVSSNPVLFPGSIRQNVDFGCNRPDTDIKKALIQCNLSHLACIIDHPIGSSLSLGQKQRLALARALLRNPAVLLLDEALSALDSHIESEIISRIKPGRTLFIASRRLKTLEKCDRVLVLSSGSLVTLNH